VPELGIGGLLRPGSAPKGLSWLTIPLHGWSRHRRGCGPAFDPPRPAQKPRSASLWKNQTMLYTIAIVLVILWLLGLVSSYTISGFIHILLVIAIILILVRVINGRKPI
jgi:hypothetical protein